MEEGSLYALHAGAQDIMPRPLSQGRGGAMQSTPSGSDFDAGTVLVSSQPLSIKISGSQCMHLVLQKPQLGI